MKKIIKRLAEVKQRKIAISKRGRDKAKGIKAFEIAKMELTKLISSLDISNDELLIIQGMLMSSTNYKNEINKISNKILRSKLIEFIELKEQQDNEEFSNTAIIIAGMLHSYLTTEDYTKNKEYKRIINLAKELNDKMGCNLYVFDDNIHSDEIIAKILLSQDDNIAISRHKVIEVFYDTMISIDQEVFNKIILKYAGIISSLAAISDIKHTNLLMPILDMWTEYGHFYAHSHAALVFEDDTKNALIYSAKIPVKECLIYMGDVLMDVGEWAQTPEVKEDLHSGAGKLKYDLATRWNDTSSELHKQIPKEFVDNMGYLFQFNSEECIPL